MSKTQNELQKGIDLNPYAGRWVALVRDQITGVGLSKRAAWLASKHQRPKEDPQVFFVEERVEAKK